MPPRCYFPVLAGSEDDWTLAEIPAREVFCTHYDRCLNAAILNHWPSWDCDDCDEYEEMSNEQHQLDLAGLLQIFREVTGDIPT